MAKRHIGEAIAKVRTRRNLSRSELDRRAGLSVGHVARIELGAGATFATIERIAAALGVTIGELSR